MVSKGVKIMLEFLLFACCKSTIDYNTFMAVCAISFRSLSSTSSGTAELDRQLTPVLIAKVSVYLKTIWQR